MHKSSQIADLLETVSWYLGAAELARLDERLDRLRQAEDSFRETAMKVLGSIESDEARRILKEIITFCEPVSLFDSNTIERVQWLERIRLEIIGLN